MVSKILFMKIKLTLNLNCIVIISHRVWAVAENTKTLIYIFNKTATVIACLKNFFRKIYHCFAND